VPEQSPDERLLESRSIKTRTTTVDESDSSRGVVIALLTVTVPGSDTVKVPITNLQTKLVIGRDARADIPINNQVVSRLHAVISHDRGKFTVEDLHSKNGTLLNGKYLPSKPVRLSHGDEIHIGKIVVLFQDYQTQRAVPDGISSLPRVATTTPMLIPTGYGPLDAQLGGGIPVGYAVLLLSHSCDERDLLLRRIIESAVGSERPSILVSDDLSKITQFAGFSRDFYAFSSHASRASEAHSGPIWIPGVENLSELNISLSTGIADTQMDLKREKLLVIEILSDVLLQHRSTITRRWLSDFIAKRKAQSFTLIATMNPSIAPESEVSAIVDLFDGVLAIREKETKAGTATLIGIKRLFARKYSSNEILVDKEKLF
jgi:pSer/pThr/pTyr-binding forkhead associated (FHA) protein